MITIQALNKRIKNIERIFGKSSKIYKDFDYYIRRDFPENYSSKGGYIHLKGIKITGEVEQLEKLEKLEHLMRMPTARTLIKRGRMLAKERGLKPTRENAIATYNNYSGFSDIINDNIELLYQFDNSEYKKALNILKIKGRRKTYDELQKVVDILTDEKIRIEATPKVGDL